jgi:TonB family protein
LGSCTKVQLTGSLLLLSKRRLARPRNVLIFNEPLPRLRENRSQVRTWVTTFVLGIALLSLVSLQPSAFPQETNQGESKRNPTAKVQPKFPALARQLKLSGKVKVEVIVTPDGRVKDTRIIGGSPILVNAALDAIRMWRYEAGPKETIEVIQIDFKDPNR